MDSLELDSADVVAIADELQAEAAQLLRVTQLVELLRDRFGDAMLTGSAAYNLMVWRDLDIHMKIEAHRWVDWMELGRTIAARLRDAGFVVHRASYLNDYVDPHPLGAGLYWGFEFRDKQQNVWNADFWGWDPFDYAVRQARDDNFRADLLQADRALILSLKTEARDLNAYGQGILSYDIYQFVLAGGGTTIEELEAWKAAR